jgi:hypothetical protein
MVAKTGTQVNTMQTQALTPEEGKPEMRRALTPEEARLEQQLRAIRIDQVIGAPQRQAAQEVATVWSNRIAVVAAVLGLVHLLGKSDTLRGFAVLNLAGESVVDAMKTSASAVYARVFGVATSA